ncbi:MAG: molecular chaperone HtpG, partial [Clostridiales bacterium]|nr:molecular chaperone HtpG [Clostridiales bacterium]
KEFRNITQDDLGLASEDEKKAAEEQAEKAKSTLDFIKETLGEAVKVVRLSQNLGSHPVCVVPAEGMTFEMEKYFKRVDPNSGMKADRILEFNADHPIFAKLQIAVAQDEKKAEDLVKILYTQALLMADLPVENAGEYADLVCSLIG